MRRKDDFTVTYRWLYRGVFAIDVLIIIAHLIQKRYTHAAVVAVAVSFMVWSWVSLIRTEKRLNSERLARSKVYVVGVCGECEHYIPLEDAEGFPICPKTGEEINGFCCTGFKARE